MNCPYCGAPLRPEEIRCAYCGHENEALARNAHTQEVSGIRKDTHQTLQSPRKADRTGRYVIAVFALVFAIFAIVALLLAFIWSRITPVVQMNTQTTQLERLESLYQQGSYSLLYEEMQDLQDAHRAVYDKYRIVGDMQHTLDALQEELPETLDLIADYPPAADLLAYDLSDLFGILNTCEDLASGGFVYQEGTAVESLQNQAYAILQQDLQLSDSEIRYGMTLARTESPDFAPLYTLISEHIQGGTP